MDNRLNRVRTFDLWPDRTRTLLTRWPDPLWIERWFWRRCATSEYFLPKVSGLRSTRTDDENFQNYKFIKYWKVKIICSLQNYKNRVRHRVYHTGPWPDQTRPKSLTRWLVTRFQQCRGPRDNEKNWTEGKAQIDCNSVHSTLPSSHWISVLLEPGSPYLFYNTIIRTVIIPTKTWWIR